MRHTDRLRPGRVPLHAFAGAILVLAGEALIIAHHRPVSDYYFPFAWFGYTLVLDGALKTQTGTSLWSDRRGLFAALLCLSVGFWWLFELFNVAVRNWVYVGAQSYSGLSYVAFASIDFSLVLPAVWTSSLFVVSLLPPGAARTRLRAVPKPLLAALLVAGAACISLPVLFPGYAFGLIWLCMFFLLDPINYLLGRPSIVAELWSGHFGPALSFAAGALMCGFFWEAWNYWAMPKWTYDIPHVGFWHVFEMPLLGWSGYLPFGLELFAMTNFVLPLIGLGTLALDVRATGGAARERTPAPGESPDRRRAS
ncbi:MAG TPA: hypothetical protein VKX16_07650 [Chloroflexota bacterium]|nr:hypothetical protein [Chloroflexota bacterium]